MTAGRGLIHAEISSNDFKSKGGPLEILQLWVNLPQKYKMTEPKYIGLQKEQIPSIALDEGKVTVNLISGKWEEKNGPIQPLADISPTSIYFKEGGSIKTTVPADHTVFFYVVKAELTVNGVDAFHYHLVEFEHSWEEIEIKQTPRLSFCLGMLRLSKSRLFLMVLL